MSSYRFADGEKTTTNDKTEAVSSHYGSGSHAPLSYDGKLRSAPIHHHHHPPPHQIGGKKNPHGQLLHLSSPPILRLTNQTTTSSASRPTTKSATKPSPGASSPCS
jgi:hypothetical protein